jgi:hypothetical protein
MERDLMTKTKLLYLLLIPLGGIIIYTNHAVDSVTRASTQETAVLKPPASPAPKPVEVTADAATDPSQYGIEVTGHSRTQKDWGNAMEATLSDPGVTTPLEQQGILQELKSNPGLIKEKLDRIEDEIALQEQKVRQRPGDEEEESRLESLYMLKGMLTTLGKQNTSTENNSPR